MAVQRYRRRVEGMLNEADIRIGGDRPWDVQLHNESIFSRVVAQGLQLQVPLRPQPVPLVNQQGIILFMATIGLSFFLEGFGQAIFGADPKPMPTDALFIPDGKLKLWGDVFDKPVRIYELDLTATIVGGLMVFGIIVFLADSEEAARSIMNKDPAIEKGLMESRLHPFRIAYVGKGIFQSSME